MFLIYVDFWKLQLEGISLVVISMKRIYIFLLIICSFEFFNFNQSFAVKLLIVMVVKNAVNLDANIETELCMYYIVCR